MAYKVKIDNVEFDLKDNFTIKDELNETLDSAIIQFNVYGGEANFESFDVAQIYDSENAISKKYFLVDSIDDEIHSFGSNFENDDHLYTVSLFSETKELERITLPNCSVTQPLTGTKHSVYDEILRFCSLYVPRIKVYWASATNNFVYARKFVLDPTMETRFKYIDCPEFQWNNPTLREVLNDLVSTDDCIIVVKEGIISFYDLRQKGNPIDTSKLSLSKRTMSSQDYVGELTIDMQNAIGTSSTFVCEGVTLKAPEGEGSLTTSNGVIKTLSPIYAIKRLRVKVPIRRVTAEEDTYNYAWIDITDRVLEKEEFDLLSNVYVAHGGQYLQLPDFTDSNGVTEKKHKVNFLYFKRGSNSIFNVGTPYPCHSGGITSTSRNNIDFGLYALGTMVQQIYGISDYVNNIIRIYDPDPRNLQFYLEYETLVEHSLKVGKNLPVKHPDNRIFDNQSNSYVDQEHMSIFEYAKINRLGHKLRTICGEYATESEIPQLGDYIGEEILFSREITYQDNIIKFKGTLTPNYVLRDFFTGVRAKKRSWQIAKNEDALTRHDVYKLYIETSFSQKKEQINYSDADGIINITDGHVIDFFVPIGTSNGSPYRILAAAVATLSADQNTLFPYILLDTESALLGRSICINFGFNDNYKSADYIVSDGSELTQSFYRYADDNGEYSNEIIIIFPVTTKSGSDADITETTEAGIISEVREGYEKPKVYPEEILSTPQIQARSFSMDAKVKKDNREIIRHTLQLEFCSDTKDIIVTKKFLDRICYFNKTSYAMSDYKVYLSNEKYNPNDTIVKGSATTLRVSRLSYEQRLRIALVEQDLTVAAIPSGIKSWAITDMNDNLLLAVNIPENATFMDVWFNLLRSRDDKIYSDNYNGIVVGDITSEGIAAAPTNYAAITTRASTSVNIQRRPVIRSETISGNEEESENENE